MTWLQIRQKIAGKLVADRKKAKPYTVPTFLNKNLLNANSSIKFLHLHYLHMYCMGSPKTGRFYVSAEKYAKKFHLNL